MPGYKLDNTDTDLLHEVARKRSPELLHTLIINGIASLTDDQLLVLIHAMTDEFIEVGLQPDDEPNPLGYQLEAISDYLNYIRLGEKK
ncbi:MAG: hypothetical protein ACYC0V_14580 [Armatimonadota bacterium]